MVEKTKIEIEKEIKETGEKTLFEVGIQDMNPEIVKLIGRLKFRTSYGQNVLSHSIEVAKLASIMASELGFNTSIAKRAGLLHDIGKSVDYEVEGTHAEIGAELAKKYGENQVVIDAIKSHHGNEKDPQSIIGVLIQAADTISASRPAARVEMLENYIKRLEKLEKIADSFAGVEKAYAIQAGREIRIMVEHEEVSDEEALLLAREIAKKIEEEVEYPGQIKVTVIRETRAVEYAK
jgi:ribonuclease Y